MNSSSPGDVSFFIGPAPEKQNNVYQNSPLTSLSFFPPVHDALFPSLSSVLLRRPGESLTFFLRTGKNGAVLEYELTFKS